MNELLKPLYAVILRYGRGPIGKLVASTLIGAIALGAFGLTSKAPEIHRLWKQFTEIGGGIGFMSALILIGHDIERGVDVDDVTLKSASLPRGFGTFLVVTSAVGTLVIVVYTILFTSDLMKGR